MKSYLWFTFLFINPYIAFAPNEYPEYERNEIECPSRSEVWQAINRHPYLTGLLLTHMISFCIPKKIFPAQLLLLSVPSGVVIGSTISLRNQRISQRLRQTD